jgi:hypothetical protein
LKKCHLVPRALQANIIFKMACGQSWELWCLPTSPEMDNGSSMQILWILMWNNCSPPQWLSGYNCNSNWSWYLLSYSGEWNTREHSSYCAFRCIYRMCPWVWPLEFQSKFGIYTQATITSTNVRVNPTQQNNQNLKMKITNDADWSYLMNIFHIVANADALTLKTDSSQQ